MSIHICDFCSEPNVAWRYPAESFIAYAAGGFVGQSVGDWAACSKCHRLIKAGDRAGLLQRSLDALLEKNPDMREAEAEFRDEISGFHRMFFEHQTGAPLPVV